MFYLPSRTVIKVSNNLQFFQGLFTADLKNGNLNFTAFLNHRGRFLFDLFLHKKDSNFYIDINSSFVSDFIKLINHYDLLKEIKIDLQNDLKVFAKESFLTNWKAGKLEGRLISNQNFSNLKTEEEYNLERIKLCLPDGFLNLTSEKSIILEYGFEEAGAVSYEKGCYVGQELITRTKRLGEVRKALFCLYNKKGDFLEIENVLEIRKNFALILGKKEEFEALKTLNFKGKEYSIVSSSLK